MILIRPPAPALTRDDRTFLKEVYLVMLNEAAAGDDDARAGLADPFWQFYADLFIPGGYDEATIERLIRAVKPRRRRVNL